MTEIDETQSEPFFNLSSKRFILILFLINVALISFILLPKLLNQMKIEQTECNIKEKRIEEKTCQTKECKGKGRKAKCKTISYPCYYWTIVVENSKSELHNITTKFPTKFKQESEKEIEKYQDQSKVPCFSLNSEYLLETPSLINHLLFSIVYLFLVGIALYSLHFYSLKGKDYKYKSGYSKKDLKKPLKKAKVKFN